MFSCVPSEIISFGSRTGCSLHHRRQHFRLQVALTWDKHFIAGVGEQLKLVPDPRLQRANSLSQSRYRLHR